MSDKFLICVGSVVLSFIILMSLGVYLGYGIPIMSMWVFVFIVGFISFMGCLAIYFGIKSKPQSQSFTGVMQK